MTKITFSSILWLAIPAMFSGVLNNLYRVVDQYMIQELGTESQAAIGSSTFVLIAMYGCFLLVSAGAGPLCARAFGAQDQDKIKSVIGQSLKITFGVGLFYSLFLCCGSSFFPKFLGLYDQSGHLMSIYLFWLGIFGISFPFGVTIDALFVAMGNTKTPLFLQVLSTVLNAFLNWLLIFHFQWGIQGAAVASGISRCTTSIIGYQILIQQISPNWRAQDLMASILKIGYPSALGTMSFAMVYWALLRWVVSPLGPEANAALGIGFSALESLSWPMFAGIMVAMSSVVGQSLGAQRPENCDKAIQLMMPFTFGLGLCVGIIMILFSSELASTFTSDQLAFQYVVSYSIIIGISQIFVAGEAFFEGVLAGAGATKVLLYASAPINILRIPMGFILAHTYGWGIEGVWFAILLTTTSKCLIKGWIVYRGTWKQVKLESNHQRIG